MMKKSLGIFLWMVLMASIALGQTKLPAFYESYQYYDYALELYQKKRFGAAQKYFANYLAESPSKTEAELRENAQFYIAAGAWHLDRADAESLLLEFVKKHSDNSKTALAKYYLGHTLFQRRQYEQAQEYLAAASGSGVVSKEEQEELRFMLGYAYFIEEDYDQARPFLQQVAAGQGERQEESQYYLALIEYQKGNYQEAYSAFDKLKNSNRYGKETVIYLANCLLILKKYDELDALGTKLLEDPSVQVANPQVYFILANSSFENQDYQNSAKYFDAYANRRGKLNPTGYFRYGYCKYKQEKYKDANPLLRRALIQKDSLAAIASYYLGFCYLKEENPESAKYAFKKTADSDELQNAKLKEDALYQYAKLAFATKDYTESLRILRILEESYPNSKHIPEVKSLIGEILFYTRNYPDAIQYFESVSLTSQRSRQAYQTVCYYYALDFFEKRQFGESMPYFEKAINSNYDKDMALSARYWMAEARFQSGDIPAAMAAYKQYQEQSGADQNEFYPLASYGLGWSYFKQKQYTSALKHFDSYISLKDRNTPPTLLVDAYLRAGDCRFLKKEYRQSANYYSQVEDMNFTHQDYAMYQVAETYYRADQYQRAIQKFKDMVTKYRTSELRDDALDKIAEIYMDGLNDNEKASLYSAMLVRDYPRSPLAAGAYNRMALAAYFEGDEDKAVEYFKQVVTDYPQDSKNAQIALDNLAAILPPNQFDKILKNYSQSNPEVNEQLAELTMNTGKDRFFSENYTSAVEQFTSYIDGFPSGRDYFEALIYRARSYKALEENERALADYQKVYTATPKHAFTDIAFLEAAEIKFESGNYMSSLQLYQMLEQSAQKLQNKVQAKFGIAKNYISMGDYGPAKDVLVQIEANNSATEYSRTKAKVQIGMCEYYLGELATAFTTFKGVEATAKNMFGAQSQYMITRILFDQNKPEEAKSAGLYLKNFYATHNYWKAKAFLVVAEANLALGDTFQAKGVLESLVSEERYPDIQEEAEKRLEEILTLQFGNASQRRANPGIIEEDDEGGE